MATGESGATSEAHTYIVTIDSLPPSIRPRCRTLSARCFGTEPAPVTGAVVPAVGGLPGNGGWTVVEVGGGGGGWIVVLVAEGDDSEAKAALMLEEEEEVMAEAEAEVEAAAVVFAVGGLPGGAVSGWDRGAGERPPQPRLMLATHRANAAPVAARLPLCTLTISTPVTLRHYPSP